MIIVYLRSEYDNMSMYDNISGSLLGPAAAFNACFSSLDLIGCEIIE